MSKELSKITKVEKKKKLNWHQALRFVTLVALGVLAYAGVMSLIKGDVWVIRAVALVVVALLVKETL